MGFRYGDDGDGTGTTFAGPSGQIDVGDANNEGASASASRADHQHALPAPVGPPGDVAAAGAAGAATTVARGDHTHAHTAAHHRAGGHADLTGDFAAVGAPGDAVAAHEGAADPHAQYLTQTEGDGRYPLTAAAVLQALADAKGDLIVATGPDTFARLPVGVTDGHLLAVDAISPGGLKYVAPPSGGVTDHGALAGLADDDHPQYFNQARGDARYALASSVQSLEAKDTAGTSGRESVTWTTAFATTPAVVVSALVPSLADVATHVETRSTTAATVISQMAGGLSSRVKSVIATGLT